MVQYQSTFNGTAGNMLASVLVFLCLILLLAEVRSRGTARYARIGSGAPGQGHRGCRCTPTSCPRSSRCSRSPCWPSGCPSGLCCAGSSPAGLEIWAPTNSCPALLQTLLYGWRGAAATTVVAFPMAYLAVRRPSWFSKLAGALQLRHQLACPGIVVGLAFVTVSIRLLPGHLPDGGRAGRRLRAAVPAPGAGQPPLRAGPGAEGTRRGRPGAGHAAAAVLRPGDAAAHRARCGRRARHWSSSASSTS